MTQRSTFLVLALGAFLLAAAPLAAEGGLALSVGQFAVIDDHEPNKAVEVGIEYRFRPFRLFERLDLTPVLGVSATEEEAVWIYAGLRYDIPLGDRWVLTPHFAASLFDEGDGKDLGGVVEFRSGLEIAVRITAGSRLGLSFYHLSNAGIYDRNPGVESLVLTWSLGR